MNIRLECIRIFVWWCFILRGRGHCTWSD